MSDSINTFSRIQPVSAVSQLMNLLLSISQSTFGCSHSSESVVESLMEHLDALSRCSGIRPEQPQNLDWVEIWALTRPLQNIQLVVFELFLCTFWCMFGVVVCGELQYSFFPFVLQLYFVLAILVNQNGPSRHKFFYSTLNCTRVICFTDINEPDLCWNSSANIQAKNSHWILKWNGLNLSAV